MISCVRESLIAVFFGALIAPVWIGHYRLNISQLVVFLLLWLTLRWLICAVNGKYALYLNGWLSLFRRIPLYFVTGLTWWVSFNSFQAGQWVSVLIICSLNIGLSIFFLSGRFFTLATFEQDLAVDMKEKQKYTALIFSMSMDIEKLPKIKPPRKKPLLYGKSNRLFKERTPKKGFLELFIKAVTRNTEYIRKYIQLIGVTGAAIVILPPLWLKLSIAFAGFFFLLFWLGNVWDKVVGVHPFSQRYRREEGYFQAKKSVMYILSIPFIIVCAFDIWLVFLLKNFFPFL